MNKRSSFSVLDQSGFNRETKITLVVSGESEKQNHGLVRNISVYEQYRDGCV